MVLRKLLVTVLTFQFSVGTAVLTYAHEASRPGGSKSVLQAADFAKPLIANLAAESPVFQEFLKSPELPSPQIDSRDSGVDQNPFFQRSQAWDRLASVALADEPSFTKSQDGSVQIHLPALSRTLRISERLTPILFTDEFVFLSADSNSTLFERASGRLANGESVGQGLFFMDYHELQLQARLQRPANVYFFPLPGTSWKGPVRSDEVPEFDSIVVTGADRETLPISLDDVRQVKKVQALNAYLGSIVALRAQGAMDEAARALKRLNITRFSDLQRLLSDPRMNRDLELARAMALPMPARGSTYGFGLLFTGFDLDYPENSIWNQPEKRGFFSLRNLKRLNPFHVGEAYASDDIYAQLTKQLINFAWHFGAITAASVIMKYTLYRQKFADVHAIRNLQRIPVIEFDLSTVKALLDAGYRSPAQVSQASPEQLAQIEVEGTPGRPKEKIGLERARTIIESAVPAAEQLKAEERAPRSAFLKNWGQDLSQLVPNSIKAPVQGWAGQIGGRIADRIPEPVKEAKLAGDRIAHRIYTETKDNGTVLAHSLTALAQIPLVLPATMLERLGDRYFPQYAAGDNKLARKILNYTFLWARSVNTATPVNMNTFMKGGVLFGTVDSAQLALQVIWAVPELCQALAPHLAPALGQRINETFEPGNPQTRNVMVAEIISNYIDWITTGASDLAQYSQAQNETRLRKAVDDVMRRRGKNPLDPANHAEREALLKDALNMKFKQLGLPDQIDFVFDLTTADARILQFLGYKVDEKKKQDAGFSSDQNVMAELRPTLLTAAILRALKVLKKELAEAPTQAKLKAVEILETHRRNTRLLSLDLRDPVRSMNAIRENRMIGALLTVPGDVSAVVSYVPELWKGIDPDGAELASVRVRQAFFSYLTGDGTLLKLPTEFIASNVKEASRLAMKLAREHYGISEAEVHQKHSAQYALEVERILRDWYVDQVKNDKAEAYVHPGLGWYEKRQYKRALRKVNDEILGDSQFYSLAEEEQERVMQRLFAKAMSREVSLYLDEKSRESRELLDHVYREAEHNSAAEISSDPGLMRYLEKLRNGEPVPGNVGANPAAEILRIKLSIFAKNFLEVYRTATVDEELVKPLSPAQPGMTQWIRQTRIIRNSVVATRLTRLLDSIVSDEEGYRPGFKAKIDRWVPAFYDYRTNVSIVAKSFVPDSTAGWAFNRYFWGVQMSLGAHVLSVALRPLIFAPKQWLTRLMRQQGLAPMDGVFSNIMYSIPYAWVTFAGSIPLLLGAKEATAAGRVLIRTLTDSELYRLLSNLDASAIPMAAAGLLVAEAARRYGTQQAIARGQAALGGTGRRPSVLDRVQLSDAYVCGEGVFGAGF